MRKWDNHYIFSVNSVNGNALYYCINGFFHLVYPELSLITLHWFLTSFASVVDIRLLLRIWDLLFYQGSLVLFQITLGMLKIKVFLLHNLLSDL